MLAHFAFLDKGTCCQSPATPWLNYWPMLLSLCIRVRGAGHGTRPIGDKACDIHWMLLSSQVLIYMDPIHECVSNLSLPFFSQSHGSRRAGVLCPLQAPFLPHQWKGKQRAGILVIYSSLPAWRRWGNQRLLESVGLYSYKWGHHLALDQANSSLWMAFGRKQKSTPKDRLFPLHY